MCRYGFVNTRGSNGCRGQTALQRACSETKNSCQEVIFRAARWQEQNEAGMTKDRRCTVCIAIPIVMDYVKYSAKLVVFRVYRTLETFPYTPRAQQHQKIHLQHEIKN